MNQKIEKYSLKSKAMYGCGDMFAGGAFLLIGLLFLNYLTDVVLLSRLLPVVSFSWERSGMRYPIL